MQEKIEFRITLSSEFWDKQPTADIYIDDQLKFSDSVPGSQTIIFDHNLNFGPHQLKIVRANKTNDQCQDGKDQKLNLVSVVIDGVNIRNIIWHYSWYEPKYPQPWALLQQKQGIQLESRIFGETTFGHNGTWYLNFTSPFYRYVMDWMNGDIVI